MPDCSARTRMASPHCLQGCGILRSFRISAPRLRSVQRYHRHSRTDTADRRSLCVVNTNSILPQMYCHTRVRDARTTHCKTLQLQTASARSQRSFAAAAANTGSSATTSDQDSSPSKTYIALSILAVVIFGVANRVLYKMALVPMGNYVFFLAQLQTFGYVAVYFSILFARYKSGVVTQEMLNTPKKQFLLIGALEAAAQILGFLGAAKLPGVALPLLQQSMMLWQIGLGYFMLGKRLAVTQVFVMLSTHGDEYVLLAMPVVPDNDNVAYILGAIVVTAGVCTAAAPAQGGVGVLSEASPMYAALFVGSMFFPALATIFKERIFSQAKQRLKGQSLDLFVVNSFGSAAQALFIFLLLPVMSSLRHIPITELPNYLSQGAACLMGGSPSCGSDCSGAPWLPLLYIAFNLGFNIAALNLLKTAGNVVQTLVMSSIVPATIFAFTLSLPYLPAAPPLGPNFWLGTAVLVAGLLTFNSPQWRPMLQRNLQGKAA